MAPRRDPARAGLAMFAEEMRAHRAHASLSRDDLAARLHFSPSLVAMVEAGHRAPSRDFPARPDKLFGVPGTFTRLHERLHEVPFPPAFRPFTGYEANATALRWFEHSLVPGLLQTEADARAVLSTQPDTSGEEIDELVAARMEPCPRGPAAPVRPAGRGGAAPPGLAARLDARPA